MANIFPTTSEKPADGSYSKNSRWVTANLGDISSIGDLLSDIENTLEDANGGVQTLIDITKAVIAIVDVASELVALVEDVSKAPLEAALNVLKVLKEELIEFLNKIFNFGLYVLPHIETFDITTAIRNELLSPGFESVSAKPQEGYTRVPNPNNPKEWHYQRAIRASRNPSFGYDTFIQDILQSFNDERDLLRPQFDNNTDVSGITMAIASDRLALFVILYLLCMMFYKGQDATTAQMSSLSKIIRIVLGQSETLARTENASTREELIAVLEQMDATIGARELGEDFYTVAKRFLDIFPRKEDKNKDASGAIALNSITFSGPSSYSFVQDVAEYNSNTVVFNKFDKSNTIDGYNPSTSKQFSSPFNMANYATATISTNGKGALYAVYEYNGQSYTAYVGSGESSYDVTIPLIGSVAGYTATNSNVTVSTDNTELTLTATTPGGGIINWDHNLGTAITPTKVVFYLCKIDNGIEPQNIDPITAKSQSATLYIPKIDRTEEFGRSLGDGFRHSMSVTIEPTTSAQKNKIAKYIGVSSDEIDNMFPMTVYPNTDLTKLGPNLDTVDITVVARPQTVLNSSYNPKLIVNGTEYKAEEKSFTPTTVRSVYTNVDVNNAKSLLLQYIAQQNSTFDVNGTETQYTIYSTVETYDLKLDGGLLAAPTIESGDRINVSNSAFTVEKLDDSRSLRESISKKKTTKPTGGPGLDRLSGFGNQYNKLYGQQLGPTLGSNVEAPESFNALYTLSGRKGSTSHVYVVIKKENKSWMQWIGGFNTIDFIDNFDIDNATRYSGTLILPWEGKDTTYTLNVYQTTDKNLLDIIIALSGDKQEETFLNTLLNNSTTKRTHASKVASKQVTVTSNSSQLEVTPPNWLNISLSAFFPIVPPIEARLNELLEILEDSIPTAPYDGIQDWLELIKAKIQKIVAIFEAIQAILANINSILQIGGDGFYFLGVANAHGNEGFKQRLQKVPPRSELVNAKYVTGVQFLVPGQIGKDFVRLFDKLPSNGQDNVEQTRNKDYQERATEEVETALRKPTVSQLKRSSRQYNTKFDGAVTEPIKNPDFTKRKEFDNG